jgi:catechol 2,3-dioxygenase-like lactoylglutathione lyase family enzyme
MCFIILTMTYRLLIFLVALILKANLAWTQEEPVLKVHHVTISAGNLDSMKNWYVRVLNCHVIRERTDSVTKYVRLGLNGFFIDILQIRGSYRQPSQDLSVENHMKAQGYRHLVLEPENLEQAHALLKKKGIVFFNDEHLDRRDIAHNVFFKDPEGNVIELHTEPAQ